MAFKGVAFRPTVDLSTAAMESRKKFVLSMYWEKLDYES